MYDLIIRNGTVVDGTGLPRYRADVAIAGERIAKIGRINERGHREFDAGGQVVSPGFIDGHTHMDAQVFWDPLGTSSCWHGVTSVVMGNCGFTLAPARKDQRRFVISSLERAEDIKAATIDAGIDWTWERFRSYLEALERLPRGINYAANIGHSALRTWAMGERAFDQAATEDDLALMQSELSDALKAGAIGFTTSRGHHLMMDDRPVASRIAEWSEVEQLVGTMGRMGGGLFELAEDFRGYEPEHQLRNLERLKTLAVDSGVPITFGVLSAPENPGGWKLRLDLLDATAAAGGRMFGQSHARDISILLSFRTRLPFDMLDEWRPVRALSLDEQRKAFTDRDVRARLVQAARHGPYPKGYGTESRPPDYERLCALRTALPDRNPSVASIAAVRGIDPVEAMIDLALETDFNQFFQQPVSNLDMAHVEAILRHPQTVVTFSDSGAHVSQIMDSSIPTTLLAYWVRERGLFSLEEGVRMITLAPARAWGFHDRGLVREGMVADLNVFDPARILPALPEVRRDLPGNGLRLTQRCQGILATIVSGQVLLLHGEHTGALPGKLLRGSLAAP